MADDAYQPWPYFTHLSTSTLMRHMDWERFDVSESSHLYKLVDALCGEAGAGDLVRQSLVARANADVQTTWFRDLDALFGGILGYPRLDYETYRFDPMSDQLTRAQFDEAMVKDAWYRARVGDMLQGLQAGGTIEGVRSQVRGVTGEDPDVYEAWRFKARYPLFGRLERANDREIIVVPASPVSERERKTILHVTDRLKPADSFVTLSEGGIPALTETAPRRAAADSSYFEIRKQVTQNVDMSLVPAPEYVAEDLWAGQKWLYELEKGQTGEAPVAAFSTGQEFSLYYGLSDSQITGVAYTSLLSGVEYAEEAWVEASEEPVWGAWQDLGLADSPDNYPGGRFGVTPLEAPAVYPDGTAYVFEYGSQADYLAARAAEITAAGGQVDGSRWRERLGVVSGSRSFFPDASLSSQPPAVGELKVSWFSDRQYTEA